MEEGIGDAVRPNNKFESQGESIKDSCKTRKEERMQFQSSYTSQRKVWILRN